MRKNKKRTQGNIQDGNHSNIPSTSGINTHDNIQTIIFTTMHQGIVN